MGRGCGRNARAQVGRGRYGKAFLWSAKNPEKLADFKLPFADIEGGKLVANRRGLFAARGALAGARGGVEIPGGGRDGIEGMVAAYLARFDELLGKADPATHVAAVKAMMRDADMSAADMADETGMEEE